MLATVPDLLDRIRSELDDRVAALRPAVEEFERLQRAVDALAGLDAPATGTRRAQRPRATRTRRTRARSGVRAAPGQTQLRVIEQLRQNPGSSSTAVAHALDISANAAAATISRLVKQGRVRRLETGGYAPALVTGAGAQASPPADTGPAGS